MAREISFDLNCTNAGVSPNGRDSVTVSLQDVDITDIIELIGIEDLIRYHGVDSFLKEIDERDARKFYGIED